MQWAASLRMIGALVLGIALGFIIFGGLQYYFKAEFWISALVAAAGGVYSAAVPLLDLAKKGYEIRKLQYELRKLKRDDGLVQVAGHADVLKLTLEKKQVLRTESIVSDVKIE